MVKKILIIFLLVAFSSFSLFSANFEEEKTKTSDGEKFVFPADALRTGPAIFAITMAKDRENGSLQQLQVLGWQEYFNQNPNMLGSVPLYHFPVLSGVPFFAKGLIRNALYDYYADKTDPSKVGVLFISKREKFADQAGFPLDNNGTLVVVAPDGAIKGCVKGEVDPTNIERLQKILATL